MSYLFVIESLDMSNREDTWVGSYSDPIVLSDGENDGGSDSDWDSFTSLDLEMHCGLKVSNPNSDDEVI